MVVRSQRLKNIIIVTIGVGIILIAIAYIVAPSTTTPGTQTIMIHVDMFDYWFRPNPIIVPESFLKSGGVVVLQVQNHADVPHTFTISALNIDVVVPPGGGIRYVTLKNLSPGTYEIICRYHVNLGMVAQLIVTK